MFQERYLAIIEAINEIAKVKSNLHSILVDEIDIKWPANAPDELKLFPYHYDAATYARFADALKQLY